jgi:hypothetical protein
MEELDLSKPVELYAGKGLQNTNGDYYPAGIYQPGALPDHFLKPEYCRNVSIPAPSPVIGDRLQLEPLLNTQPVIQPLVTKPGEAEKLNINTADINQIIKIEGISTAAANKIVIDRDTNGVYKDAADLIARQNLSKLASTIDEKFSF